MTSLQMLNKEVSLARNKSWVSLTQPSVNVFTEEEVKPRETSHGFLNVTFTRAQRRNVKRKMNKMHGDTAEEHHEGTAENTVYLSEVCFDIQPCDIVLNCPAMAKAFQVFHLEHSKVNIPHYKFHY